MGWGSPKGEEEEEEEEVEGAGCSRQEHSENEGLEVKTNKLSLRMRREIVAAAGDQEEVRSQRLARPHQGHKATKRRLGAKS